MSCLFQDCIYTNVGNIQSKWFQTLPMVLERSGKGASDCLSLRQKHLILVFIHIHAHLLICICYMLTETLNTKTLYTFLAKRYQIYNWKMQPKFALLYFFAKRYQNWQFNDYYYLIIVTFSIWVSFGSVNVLLCFGQQGWHVDWDNI